ncbi:MAG: hypothetical protein ACYTGN_13310 [Planctomycetota bacterium]|jgi:hypothetical protein
MTICKKGRKLERCKKAPKYRCKRCGADARRKGALCKPKSL